MLSPAVPRAMLPKVLPRQTLAFRSPKLPTPIARNITTQPRTQFTPSRVATLAPLRPLSFGPSRAVPQTPRLAVLFSTSPKRFILTPPGIPDEKRHQELLKQKLKPKPASDVTSSSTTTPMFERENPEAPEKNMRKELGEELHSVRETFSMKDVPKDLSTMGVLGLVPYVATSATALFLAWDVTHAAETGTLPYLVSAETAHKLLAIAEPIQLGYGAVLLSFLGAIHWGLEFAGYGGRHGYKRYAIGLLAPALSWPTTFFTYDAALVTQFLGFTGMYFADAVATKWGWAPTWYTNYRFVLTFVVGGCIVVTLIARSKIGDQSAGHATLSKNQYFLHLQEIQDEELRKEEAEILRRQQEKDEADRKKKEEAARSKSVDSHRSVERAERGALKQARKTTGGEYTTESTEMRRQKDAAEEDKDKEAKGPKRTGKPVDPETVKGKDQVNKKNEEHGKTTDNL